MKKQSKSREKEKVIVDEKLGLLAESTAQPQSTSFTSSTAPSPSRSPSSPESETGTLSGAMIVPTLSGEEHLSVSDPQPSTSKEAGIKVLLFFIFLIFLHFQFNILF